MPADPSQVQALIGSSDFQALGPAEQVSVLRSHLRQVDDEYRNLDTNPTMQDEVARMTIDKLQPGFLDRLAGAGRVVAGFVPGLAGGLRAREQFQQTGEVGAIPAAIANYASGFSGGVESPTGAFAAGAAADVGEFLLASMLGIGAARFGLPLVGLGRAATGNAIGEALGAGARLGGIGAEQATRTAVVEVGRTAFRNRVLETGITDFAIGSAFQVVDAMERVINNEEQAPLSHWLLGPLAITGLGIGILGAKRALAKFGQRAFATAFEDIVANKAGDFAALQEEAGSVVQAVYKAGGRDKFPGGPDDAAEYVYDAVTGPLKSRADNEILKNVIRSNPEILNTELGQRIALTQRDRLFSPEFHVDSTTQSLRVTYDGPGGRTFNEEFPRGEAPHQLFARHKDGEIIITDVRGPESLVRNFQKRFGVQTSDFPNRPFGPAQALEGVPGIEAGVGPVETYAPRSNMRKSIFRKTGEEPIPDPELEGYTRPVGEYEPATSGLGFEVESMQAAGMTFTRGLPAIPEQVRATQYLGPGQPVGEAAAARAEAAAQRAAGQIVEPAVPPPLPPALPAPYPQLEVPGAYVIRMLRDGSLTTDQLYNVSREFVIPARGTTIRAAGSELAGIVKDTDGLGRAVVDFGDGRIVKASLTRTGELDISPELLQSIPVLTNPVEAARAFTADKLRFPRELPIAEPSARGGRAIRALEAAERQSRDEIDNLIKDGQLIGPTRRHLEANPLAKPFEIQRRIGSRVVIEQTSPANPVSTVEVTIDNIIDMIESGRARIMRTEKDIESFLNSTRGFVREYEAAQRRFQSAKENFVSITDPAFRDQPEFSFKPERSGTKGRGKIKRGNYVIEQEGEIAGYIRGKDFGPTEKVQWNIVAADGTPMASRSTLSEAKDWVRNNMASARAESSREISQEDFAHRIDYMMKVFDQRPSPVFSASPETTSREIAKRPKPKNPRASKTGKGC